MAAYDDLHAHNIIYFGSEIEWFYSDALQDSNKRKVLTPEAVSQLKRDLHFFSLLKLRRSNSVENVAIGWDKDKNVATIEVDWSTADIAALNQSAEERERARQILKKVFRYDGDLEYREWDDIPF